MNSIQPANLEVIKKPYPKDLLEKWKAGDYSMLTDSYAPDYIKNILIQKAKNRPGRRFFGEAFIASTMEMTDGWYNSFKWLTAKKWITGIGLKPDFEKPFYHALIKHIDLGCLINLQSEAKKLIEGKCDDLCVVGKYKKPVAPDLWIIDRNGHFKFIECKLPDDSIAEHQLVGLALIEKYVGAIRPVSIIVMELFST